MGKAESPKISIITPTYNRAHLLPRAWASLKAQTFSDFEWIVVDDGSTDETESVVASFNDPRIRYIKLPKNRGVNAARNRGIEASRAPYLVFLDSDDEMVPEALEEMLKAWEEVDDPMVGKIAFRCLEADTGEIVGRMEGDQLLLGYEEIICEEKVQGDFFGIAKRELFDQHRFPRYICGVEALFGWKVAREWKTLYINHALLIDHTEGEDRLSGTEGIISRAEDMAIGFDRLCEEHKEAWLRNCPRQYRHYLLRSAFYHALAGNRLQALNRAWKLVHHGYWKEGMLMLLIAPWGRRLVAQAFRLRARTRKRA